MNAPVLPEVVSGEFRLDMPEEEYHQHPALSASGMKALLRSPKYFRAQRSLNKAKAEFDVGHAIHERILGVGAEVVEIPDEVLAANGYATTKAAREFIAEARDAGKVPLKRPTYLAVTKAAESVLAHEKARRLLEAAPFREVSLFATDQETGVALRGRVDAVGDALIDVKSTTDVRDRAISRTVIDFNYDLSAATYRELLRLVLGDDPGPMHLIYVEKELPFEVRVVRLADPVWHDAGLAKMRAAIDLFAWCSERRVWPGNDDDGGDVMDLPVPAWYRAQTTEMETF